MMMDRTIEPLLNAAQNPGDWIESQCRELGVSMHRVAKEARISHTTIYRWKQGKRGPNWDSFTRVRLVLDSYWSRRGPGREAG